MNFLSLIAKDPTNIYEQFKAVLDQQVEKMQGTAEYETQIVHLISSALESSPTIPKAIEVLTAVKADLVSKEGLDLSHVVVVCLSDFIKQLGREEELEEEGECNYFERQFPDELVTLIFANFNAIELAKVTEVCQRFYNVGNSNLLWQHLAKADQYELKDPEHAKQSYVECRKEHSRISKLSRYMKQRNENQVLSHKAFSEIQQSQGTGSLKLAKLCDFFTSDHFQKWPRFFQDKLVVRTETMISNSTANFLYEFYIKIRQLDSALKLASTCHFNIEEIEREITAQDFMTKYDVFIAPQGLIPDPFYVQRIHNDAIEYCKSLTS